MKKIIVFGATGNIGAYFVDYCKKNLPSDFEVIAVGRKHTDFFTQNDITYINVDLLNSEDFNNLPKDDIYAVVNLAGLLPAYLKEYDPFAYVNTNIIGALRILEYARNNNADRVLYTQTWAEMAGFWGKEPVLSPKLGRKLKYTGDHAFYSITKCMIVDTMEFYHQEYGLKNFVFRLPNIYLYHPDTYYYVDCKKKLVAYRYMIERATAGEDIEMWGNPKAFKDIVYIKDLCQMMYKALFAEVDGGTYNVGTGIKTTLEEQIKGMVEVFSPKDNPSKIISIPGDDAFVSFVMDIDNAKTDLGYEPEYTYIKYLEDYKKERELKRFDKLWS